MDGQDKQWPAWFNGPNGETRIFYSADEVPAGWTGGAEKRTVEGARKPAPTRTTAPAPPAPPPAAAPAAGAEIDANGHPWSADLYAPTKTKTGAGLWRMKVGKSRPAPLPGFPKPAQPLDL